MQRQWPRRDRSSPSALSRVWAFERHRWSGGGGADLWADGPLVFFGVFGVLDFGVTFLICCALVIALDQMICADGHCCRGTSAKLKPLAVV